MGFKYSTSMAFRNADQLRAWSGAAWETRRGITLTQLPLLHHWVKLHRLDCPLGHVPIPHTSVFHVVGEKIVIANALVLPLVQS